MKESAALSPKAVPALVPRHLAVIMDGNHRWARSRGLPGSAGHRAGARNVRPVTEFAAELGIEALTLFAFSTENWNRPRREVSLLLALMRRMLKEDVDEIDRNNVRICIIGDRNRFSPDIRELMRSAEERTQYNTRMTLMIAANYGGRWDIVNACRLLAEQARDGLLDPADIDEEMVARSTSLAAAPPPDLCIRTGGECRISNFLLWQLAYAELYFTETYWPDFGVDALKEALGSFACRQRRFGRRSEG